MTYKFDPKGQLRKHFNVGNTMAIKEWLGKDYDLGMRLASEDQHPVYGWQYVFPCTAVEDDKQPYQPPHNQSTEDDQDYQCLSDWHQNNNFESWW